MQRQESILDQIFDFLLREEESLSADNPPQTRSDVLQQFHVGFPSPPARVSRLGKVSFVFPGFSHGSRREEHRSA